MTREEAVEVLKERYLTCVGIGLDNHANRVNEAIDMAIEALQIQDICAEMLESAKPASDVVSVVRCGERKHIMADGRCMEFADDGIRPSAMDYCSYGERRKDDER